MSGTGGANINYNLRRRIVRAGAFYDLIAVGPLAIPGLSYFQLETMFKINGLFGFSGEMPAFEPVEMLFVNLFGMTAMLWISTRLLRYEPHHCFMDIIFRSLVSVLLLFYGMTQDVHKLIWVFLAVELFILCGYYFVLNKERSAIQANPTT
jgi:hypothetical protein